jgi:hypothetical protein
VSINPREYTVRVDDGLFPHVLTLVCLQCSPGDRGVHDWEDYTPDLTEIQQAAEKHERQRHQ